MIPHMSCDFPLIPSLQQNCAEKGKLKDYGGGVGEEAGAAYHTAMKPQRKSSVAEQCPSRSYRKKRVPWRQPGDCEVSEKGRDVISKV